MNFECKSTFKSKWKRFWIISLKIGAKIEVTNTRAKHVLLADDFIPQLGICSLNSMKCVYVKFSPSKQQSFFRKVSLNSCLIGLSNFIQGALAEVLSYRNVFHVAQWQLMRAGSPEFDSGQNLFLFFSSFFSFPLRLVFFLVIVVLFCFSIQLKIFKLINFLPYCRI